MARSRTGSGQVRRGALPAAVPPCQTRGFALFVALLTLLLAVGLPAAHTLAADEPPSPITMTATPLLAGSVRSGDWAAVRVHLENAGPAVDGELRISSTEQGSSTYGIPVQLATGARQEHVIHGRTGFFGSRFTIELVRDGQVLATAQAPVQALVPETLGVIVVAERPDRILADIRSATSARQGSPARINAVAPEDLPERVEAWGAVDRLVWQDVDAARLTTQQLAALETWVALGGELVIAGGTAGTGALDAFPDRLLPYRPTTVVDVPSTDLSSLLPTLPIGATSLPALAGSLTQGTSLGTSGTQTIAARVTQGQGSVSIVGIDPATEGLAGSAIAAELWTRLLRPGARMDSDTSARDDSMLMSALSYLPSVAVPPMDQLFLLFLGYVLLLGPVSYLVLRRLDRREWAWFTMPALAVVFTVAAFTLGIVLRGTDVVINQLGVVRGAAGADRGMADVYVGVFSPSRTAFDIRLPGGALVSESTADQQDRGRQPLDILLGDPSRLRGFQVGFGSLRGFRAQTAVDTPRVDADLRFVDDRLQGRVTNASDQALEHVAIVYGGGVQLLDDLPPGATVAVDVAPGSARGRGLVRQLFEDERATDAASARSLATRVAIMRQLSGDWRWDGESVIDPLSADGPVLLAWRPGGIVDVDVGVGADQVGDTLYLLPVQVGASGAVTFTGSSMGSTVIASDAVDSSADPTGMVLDRGTMTVDYRPGGFEGELDVTGLDLLLGFGAQDPARVGKPLSPLPAAEQPDPEDPLGTGPDPLPVVDGRVLPAVQLFDRVADRWVELAPLTRGTTYSVAEPARYVDATGGLLVRFVARESEGSYGFVLGTRLTGTVR